MATFPEAQERLYGSVYICRKCESKTKVAIGRFLNGKAVCRKCGYKNLRIARMRSKK